MNNWLYKMERRFGRYGIPNLAKYLALGQLVVWVIVMFIYGDLLGLITLSRSGLMHGQIWRLVTFVFVPPLTFTPLYLVLDLYFLYFVGTSLENSWGSFRFTLYYLIGILAMDVYAMLVYFLFHVSYGVSALYLNLSMFLAVATLIPEQRVLFMFFIPLKMKWLALVDLGLTAYEVANGVYIAIINWTKYHSAYIGTYCLLIALFPLIALLNYFLFMGKDVRNLFPQRWQRSRQARKASRDFRAKVDAEPNPDWAKNYRSSTGERPYRHKCTVCGRTDTDYPDLEFRYCSKCKGYRCYCIDHINNHVHIQ